VHSGLLDELGVASAIAGVCEKEYIDLPAVTEGLATGRIADFGNGMNPNIERIMDVDPDVLLLTPFEHSGGYGRVERLGIPIIECAEYMEVSPLARAEWIRFYGELFGVADKADSIFNAVASNYLSLKEKVATPSPLPQTPSPLPRLLTEMLYGSQWFVPCGQSTMGMMFADAGADYIFRNRKGSGSTALSFETVLDEAQDADIWLIKYNSPQPLTYRQLAQDYQPYTRFRAFRERHIYSCDLAHNHFYEETPFHPDRLLRDLIIILHPELMPGEQPIYYKPLAE
jgi:iron complex transport system substrate-binding protein